MDYVIGDVHGCNEELNILLQKLKLNPDDRVYFVGDLIDRGVDSKGVIDTILRLKERIASVRYCRGNHEQLMFDSVKGESEKAAWLRNGGDTTLHSFGISTFEEMPDVYRNFFDAAEYYIDHPFALIVHAGFNFEAAQPFEDKHSMLWTRNHVCDLAQTQNRPVIHGHTPVPYNMTELHLKTGGKDINIDNGCIYKDRPGYGNLTAICLQNMQLTTVERANKIAA